MEPDEPQKKKPEIVVGENLELHSVAELALRIEALENEIARVRAALAGKQATRTAADALFRP